MTRSPSSLTALVLFLATLASFTAARSEPKETGHHETAESATGPSAPLSTPAPEAQPSALAPVTATPAEPAAAPEPTASAPQPPTASPTEPDAPAAAHDHPPAAPAPKEHAAPAARGRNALPGPDPKEVRAQIRGLQKLGTSLTDRGDWDAAEISFRQILAMRHASNDELADALIGLARVYRRQGSLTKAAAIYERFLADNPTNDQVPDALLELGRTHRALGAHQLALARFYSVINSTLKVSGEGFIHYQMLAKTAQFEIAETHFQQGNFAEANKFFSRLRLLDLAPADRARAHFKSAYALYLGQDLDGAVTTLNSYLEQWPQDENVPEARNLLALSLRSLGRKQEALDATLLLLREQSTADPKRWSYWQRRTGNQLANDFFQNGDTLNALAIYQGLAALAPEPPWRLPVTYQMALCYERMRDSARATAAYQNIVDTVGNSPTELSPELTELARMAKWRIGQLAWQTSTDSQLADLFNHLPGAPTTTVAAAPAATHATPAPAHDNSGNPAKTSPSL